MRGRGRGSVFLHHPPVSGRGQPPLVARSGSAHKPLFSQNVHSPPPPSPPIKFASLVQSLTALAGPTADYTEAVKGMESASQGMVHGPWEGKADDVNDGGSTGLFLPPGTELLVCDMAGTTVDEQGIVYITLHRTMNDHGLDVDWEDMHVWHGAEKIAVIEHFVRDRMVGKKDEEHMVAAKNACFKDFVSNIEKAYFDTDVLKVRWGRKDG